MAEFVIGIIELRSVGSDPRQRHSAAVTALFGLLVYAVECGGILQLVPRNIRDFRQSQFLTLINVGGARQGKFHKNRSAGTLGTELTVLNVTRPIADQPILGQLMMRRGRNLWQSITADMAGHIMVAHHPGGRRARHLGARQPLVDGFAHRVEGPIRLGELEVEHLPQFIR